MTEIWKDIVGYEGRYQVSNYGNIKSLAKLGDMFGVSHQTISKLLISKTWKV